MNSTIAIAQHTLFCRKPSAKFSRLLGVRMSGSISVSGTEACFQNTVLRNFILRDSTVLQMIIWNMNNIRNEGKEEWMEKCVFQHQGPTQFIGKPICNSIQNLNLL